MAWPVHPTFRVNVSPRDVCVLHGVDRKLLTNRTTTRPLLKEQSTKARLEGMRK